MAPWKITKQESNWKFKMAAPTKVSHVGKEPTSPDREPGIGLTDFHGDLNHARVTHISHVTSKSILTVVCGTKRQNSVGQEAMMKTERLGSDCRLYSVLHSMARRRRHRELIRSWHDDDVSRDLQWDSSVPKHHTLSNVTNLLFKGAQSRLNGLKSLAKLLKPFNRDWASLNIKVRYIWQCVMFGDWRNPL